MPPFGINRKYYARHKNHPIPRHKNPQTTPANNTRRQSPSPLLNTHNAPSPALARTLQRLHTNIHNALNK